MMRQIERTARFKKDFKRESKGQHHNALQTIFIDILEKLVADVELDERYHDHALIGNYSDCRDCHIKPDLVLIYRKIDDDVLQLIRMGSHSALFG